MRRVSLSTPMALLAILAVATRIDAQSAQYYVLDGFGGVHAGGGAPIISPATPYFGFEIAQDLVYLPYGISQPGPHGDGILVLDGFGGVHPGGALSGIAANPRPPYFGFDIARAIAYRSIPPRVAGVATEGGVNVTTTASYTSIQSTTIQAPDDGFLLVNASTMFFCGGNTGTVSAKVALDIDSTAGDPASVHFVYTENCSGFGSGPSFDSTSLTRLFPVGAGQHTVYLLGQRQPNSSQTPVASRRSLTVLFVDQDGVGGS